MRRCNITVGVLEDSGARLRFYLRSATMNRWYPKPKSFPRSEKPAIVSRILRLPLAPCSCRCARWGSRSITGEPCSDWSKPTRAPSFKSRRATAHRAQTALRRHSWCSSAIRARGLRGWSASPSWSTKPVKDISEALLRLAGLPDNTPQASAVLGPIMSAEVALSYIKAGSD